MDVMFQTNGELAAYLTLANRSPGPVPSDAAPREAHEAAQLWRKLRPAHPSADVQMIINVGSVAGIEPYVGGTLIILTDQLTSGSIYCATKSAVNSISGVLLRELVNTNIRVAEIQPGMVETEFSVVRYRGDKDRADNEYKGLTPRELS